MIYVVDPVAANQEEAKRAELLAVHKDLGEAHEQIQNLEARLALKDEEIQAARDSRASVLAVLGALVRQEIGVAQGEGTKIPLRRVLAVVKVLKEQA